MKKYFFAATFLYVTLSSCNNSMNNNESGETRNKDSLQTNKSDSAITNSHAQILNHITVHETGGLEIDRAYLSNEKGELIPENNKVPLDVIVYLNLSVRKGWVAENGKVSVGASERIETDKGEEILNVPDLFKDATPVDEADANAIHLKAKISKTTSVIKYFIVHYRIWDKNSDGEVTGSYQLSIE